MDFASHWWFLLFGGGIVTWIWRGGERTKAMEMTQTAHSLAIADLQAKVATAHESHVALALAVERLPTRDEVMSAIRDLRDDLRTDLRDLGRTQAGPQHAHSD